MEINLTPIGVIHSPYKELKEVPCQAYKSKGVGRVEIFKEFAEGLQDIDGFSHIILVFHLHKSKGYSLRVKPFIDNKLRGVFATRHPNRPNGIGITIVELLRREGTALSVKGIDILDGTPLLDIKPYVRPFDERAVVKIGWLEGKLNTETLEKQ